MFEITLSLIFWSIAWVFSSIQDIIQFRFDESIFSEWKIAAWIRGDYTARNKKRFPKLPPLWDGWHCAKWIKWAFLFLSIGIYHIGYAIFFGLAGSVIFNGFYHVILRKK